MFKKSPFRSFFWNNYFNTIYVIKNNLQTIKKPKLLKERKRTKRNQRTKKERKGTKYYLKIFLSYIYNEKI